jgi:UDP-4-amino-4,6-dideoxy-N-acetyl-beta-L-altrosamine N-acetyltransferase
LKIPESSFEPVSPELIETIRLWRNKPRIRERMIDDIVIDEEQQKNWFASLAKNMDKEYLVFVQDRRPIGMLYFSNIQEKSCYWGGYIGEDAVWPGSGVILEYAALEYAFNILNRDILMAEVFEDNIGPQKIHEFFGFEIIESGKDIKIKSDTEKRLNLFSYKSSDWYKNKKNIIEKMPKQLKLAIDFINFKKVLK